MNCELTAVSVGCFQFCCFASLFLPCSGTQSLSSNNTFSRRVFDTGHFLLTAHFSLGISFLGLSLMIDRLINFSVDQWLFLACRDYWNPSSLPLPPERIPLFIKVLMLPFPQELAVQFVWDALPAQVFSDPECSTAFSLRLEIHSCCAPFLPHKPCLAFCGSLIPRATLLRWTHCL